MKTSVHCYGNGSQNIRNINDGIIHRSALLIVARKQKGVVIIQDSGAWPKNKLTKS